jgi:hypothetical protein
MVSLKPSGRSGKSKTTTAPLPPNSVLSDTHPWPSPFSTLVNEEVAMPQARTRPQSAGGTRGGGGGSGSDSSDSSGDEGSSSYRVSDNRHGERPRSPSDRDRAHNVANFDRLKTIHAFQQAGILTQDEKLTPYAIAKVKLAEGKKFKINNPTVIRELTADGSHIDDWKKFKTPSIELSTGQHVQIHYYKNIKTGKVNYTHKDYKVSANIESGKRIPSPKSKPNPAGQSISAKDLLEEYRQQEKPHQPEKDKNKPFVN